MDIVIYTDGGSRGNPGHSGYGVAAFSISNQLLYQHSHYLGIATNNEAEYQGLIHGLQWVRDNLSTFPIASVVFKADSEFMVRQVNGQYKVKSPNIKPLFEKVKELQSSIPIPLSFIHIPRALNSTADALANQAMDRQNN